MAYSEQIAQKIRESLTKEADVREISMFGGRCFMLNGKMFACATKDGYLFRVGRKHHEEGFGKDGGRPMVNNGGIMKGFLFVNEEAVDNKEKLDYWIGLCYDFNQNDPARIFE